jgi:predicted transcriptional regulator
MNMQGQAARRALAMRGEQAQRAAQDVLGRQTSYIGGVRRSAQENLENLSMLADARREQRKRLWEAQLADMDRARREMIVKAWSAPIQGGLSMTTPEMANQMAGLGGRKAVTPEAVPYTPFASQPQQFAPKDAIYNPYSGQRGMMITNYGGPGATPPTYEMYEEPDFESYYTPFKK